MRWLYRIADCLRRRARARRWEPHLASGRTAEDLAHRHLQRQGMRIVGRNWRTASGSGEIDLIAREGDLLVFVEVKSRATGEHGAPDRAMDPEKLRRLRRAVEAYLSRSGHDRRMVRFDLVNVVFDQAAPLTHVRDAFRIV